MSLLNNRLRKYFVHVVPEFYRSIKNKFFSPCLMGKLAYDSNDRNGLFRLCGFLNIFLVPMKNCDVLRYNNVIISYFRVWENFEARQISRSA